MCDNQPSIQASQQIGRYGLAPRTAKRNIAIGPSANGVAGSSGMPLPRCLGQPHDDRRSLDNIPLCPWQQSFSRAAKETLDHLNRYSFRDRSIEKDEQFPLFIGQARESRPAPKRHPRRYSGEQADPGCRPSDRTGVLKDTPSRATQTSHHQQGGDQQ